MTYIQSIFDNQKYIIYTKNNILISNIYEGVEILKDHTLIIEKKNDMI